jgi:hypothetical protein
VPTYREEVSAPTLWEEGRWSGSRVTRFSVFACLMLVVADVSVTGRLERVFDSGFIVLCVGMALAVRREDFFRVGVLPPMLLLGISVILALGHRGAIAAADDGIIQSVISGLAHHSGTLLAAYALALAVLGIRVRVARRSHSNREASPAPYLLISGTPDVKSTTVVGSDPDSPSMTASNT